MTMVACLLLLGVALVEPPRADAWNFAYARVAKAFAKAKQLLKKGLRDLAVKVFGPKAQAVFDAVSKLQGRLRSLAVSATRGVSALAAELKRQSVRGLGDLGRALGDELTDGFVSRAAGFVAKGAKAVRGWIDGVRRLRADPVGSVRRALRAAVDPRREKDLTVVERLLRRLILRVFGPLAKRVVAGLAKLTGKIQQTASRVVAKVAGALRKIQEKTIGRLAAAGASLTERLGKSLVEGLESLPAGEPEKARAFATQIDQIEKAALADLDRLLAAPAGGLAPKPGSGTNR